MAARANRWPSSGLLSPTTALLPRSVIVPSVADIRFLRRAADGQWLIVQSSGLSIGRLIVFFSTSRNRLHRFSKRNSVQSHIGFRPIYG